MKKQKYFYLLFWVWIISFNLNGQHKSLKLPDKGAYNKEISIFDQSIKIARPDVESPLPNEPYMFSLGQPIVLPSDLLKFKYDLHFDMVEIKNIANFKNSRFGQDLYFKHVSFYEEALFPNSIFLKQTLFYQNTFFKGVNFAKSVFKKDANYEYSTFNNEVSFSESLFYGDLNFNGSDFRNKLDLSTINVKGNLSLSETQLPLLLNYQSTTVFNTDFRETLIDSLKYTKVRIGNVNLLNANDDRYHRCVITECNNQVDTLFYSTFIYNDSLEIEKEINLFLLAQKLKKCVIQLKDADLAKTIIPFNYFWIDTTDYNYEEKVYLYETMNKNCREYGMEESAKGWDIELKKNNIYNRYPLTGSIFIYLQEYWWNFGYERNKIFRNTTIAWGISFLIFFLFMPFFSKVYFPSNSNINIGEVSMSSINSWLRFKVALFYTTLIFFSWKMEHNEVNYRNYPLGALIIYIVFTIGIVHLAYLAGAVISN